MKDRYNYTLMEYLSLKFLLKETILDLRSKPIFMFFLEGISKLFLLILCAYISIRLYRDSKEFDYNSPFYSSEVCLIFMLVTTILYEVGQMMDDNWDIVSYFRWVWNKYDWMTILLIFTWLVCRKGTITSFHVAKCALSLASIPGSLNLLRYLCLHRSSGVLVITIMKIGIDIRFVFLLYFCL